MVQNKTVNKYPKKKFIECAKLWLLLYIFLLRTGLRKYFVMVLICLRHIFKLAVVCYIRVELRNEWYLQNDGQKCNIDKLLKNVWQFIKEREVDSLLKKFWHTLYLRKRFSIYLQFQENWKELTMFKEYRNFGK